MSEVVRHFPLTPEQERSLRALRDSARMSMGESRIARVGNNVVSAELAHNIRETLIGQNTLRFVIQNVVHNETGLKHWFDFKQYMAFDQLRISDRLIKRA